MWSCQLLPTREETVIHRFSHSSQKSTLGLWAILSAFPVMFSSLDAPVTAARGPLDAYAFGRAVLCPRLQKSWRGWLRWENKTKQNETNHSNRAELILAASEDREARRHGCHRVSNGGKWFLREKGLQRWNQEPRAMDRRTALRDNCFREGHSCPRHCLWIKEAELTSSLVKLSLPMGSVTDSHELPISWCPSLLFFSAKPQNNPGIERQRNYI